MADKDQSQFEKYIHLNTNTITSDRDYAFIGSKTDGYFSMLDVKGLCTLQVKYAMDSLGDVCTMLPRDI